MVSNDPQERLAALALSFHALNGEVCRVTDQFLTSEMWIK
jgi:hypothetical protein